MIRHATIFWVAVGALFLSGLTIVGHEVRDRDQTLRELHSAIDKEREKIHVLKAEKAYLSSSEVIARRAELELGMSEFTADRIVKISDLPQHVPEPEFAFTPPDISSPLLSTLAPTIELEEGSVSAATFIPSNWSNSARLSAYSYWMNLTARPQS